MPLHTLSWKLFRPADDLTAIHDASAKLAQRPRLLAQSAGLFCGLTIHGASLFPGLAWLLFSDAAGPAALLPVRLLVERDGPIALNCIRTINRFDMLYSDAQIRPDIDVKALLDMVLSIPLFDGRRGDVLRIHDARSGSGFERLAASAPRWMVSTQEAASCIPTTGSFAEWQSNQSKNLRGQIRRSNQRLGEKGKIEIRICTEPDELIAAYKVFVSMEAAGYKQDLNPLAREFEEFSIWEDTLRYHGDRQEAFVSQLLVEGQLAASQIGLVLGNRVHLLRVAFDETFADCSPGTTLLFRLVEWCCQRGDIETIDCVVRQRWHDRWHPRVEMSVQAIIPNRGTVSGFSVGLLRWARQKIRQAITPGLP